MTEGNDGGQRPFVMIRFGIIMHNTMSYLLSNDYTCIVNCSIFIFMFISCVQVKCHIYYISTCISVPIIFVNSVRIPNLCTQFGVELPLKNDHLMYKVKFYFIDHTYKQFFKFIIFEYLFLQYNFDHIKVNL